MLHYTDRVVTKAAALYTTTVGAADSEFTSIQAAIDASNEHDVIYVRPGAYHENISVNKVLDIYTDDNSVTTLTGDGVTPAVHVTAHAGSFKRFTVTADLNNQSGIFLDNNSPSEEVYTIDSCLCTGNKDGIEVATSSNNVITNNIATGNKQFGILLRDSANNNNVTNNQATGNADGIGIFNSSGNVLEDDDASANVNTGYSIVYSNQNTITECQSASNSVGFYFQNSDSNEATYNRLVLNLDAVKLVAALSNTIENNAVTERNVGSSFTLDANSDNNIINHNTYRIPAIDLGTNNKFTNNHTPAPAHDNDVATVHYVNSVIVPGGTNSDTIGGRLQATDGITLEWAFYSSCNIRLFDTDDLSWTMINVATEPTASNTAVDMSDNVLTHDLVYDVFAKFNSLTSFTLEFAPWQIVSTTPALWPALRR